MFESPTLCSNKSQIIRILTLWFLWMLATLLAVSHDNRKPVQQTISNSCQLLWLANGLLIACDGKFAKSNQLRKKMYNKRMYYGILQFAYLNWRRWIFHPICQQRRCTSGAYVCPPFVPWREKQKKMTKI